MIVGTVAFVAGAAGALLPVVGLTLRSIQENNISQGEAAILSALGAAVWYLGAFLVDRS